MKSNLLTIKRLRTKRVRLNILKLNLIDKFSYLGLNRDIYNHQIIRLMKIEDYYYENGIK